MNALEMKNVTKRFPGFQLENMNLTLPSGCVMGLIGENGAGKSTTIRLILDMLHSDSGSITILGRDSRENPRLTKEEVGVVLDEIGLPECLNTRQVGKVMAGSFRHWNQAEYDRIIKRFQLPEDKAFKTFSRGMKMKLGIAVAMSHGAKLLLLDEPTGGLDPVVRDEVVEMFSDFTRQEDHSILISSHIVSDLEKLCDYIAFLHTGKLLLCEEKDQLLAEYGMLHCPAEALEELDPGAVLCRKTTPYGAQAIVRRESAPPGLKLSPLSIEELFVFMVKEER